MSGPFVGAGRHAIVGQLLACFDQTSEGATPTWVNIEAPSGWGKTRLVQELYRELASSRQREPHYWPDRLANPADAEATSLLDDRKVLRPLVQHTPGSLPDFLWWAISCTRHRGHQSTALANDLRQLIAHVPYVEDALSQQRGRRVQLLGRERTGRELFDIGAEEAATLVLESVLSAALPGLGLIRPAARAVKTRVGDRRERRRRRDGTELIVEDGDELVLAAVSLLQRASASDGLPTVVVVEDLHLADRELIATLELLAGLDEARMLIVTTSWPGFTAENRYVNEAIANTESLGRLHRISEHGSTLGDAPLAPLERDDLAALVQAAFPGTRPDIVQRLTELSDNPLSLALTLELPRYDRFRGGPLDISIEDLPVRAQALSDLVISIWNELPQHAQRGIAIAALGTPLAGQPNTRDGAAHPGAGHLDEWDHKLLEAIRTTSIGSDDQGSHEMPLQYSWATPIDTAMRRFRDPLYFEVAATRVDDHLLTAEQHEFRHALAQAASDSFAQSSGSHADFLAHLLVGLSLTGVEVDDEAAADAALRVLGPLELEPSTYEDAITLCERVAATIESTAPRARIEMRRWRLSTELGDSRKAARALKGLARDLTGSDPLLMAEVMHHLAVAQLGTGELSDALDSAQQAHELRREHLGPTDSLTVRSAMNEAHLLAMNGEVPAAIDGLRDVWEISHESFGPDDTLTIASAIALAAAYSMANYTTQCEELLASTSRELSPHRRDSPIGLILEYNSLVLGSRSGVPDDEAIRARLRELHVRASLLFGSDHPFVDEIDESMTENQEDWDPFVPAMAPFRR